MTKPFHKLYDKSKLYCEDLKECDFIFSDRESVGTRHIAFLRCDFTRSHTDYLLAALIKYFVTYQIKETWVSFRAVQ